MSSAHVPITILAKLEKEYKPFLWGHSGESRGLHLISWDHVCAPKKYGGLGITSVYQKRQALLGEMAAQLIIKPQSLWAQVVCAKYKFSGSC